MSDVAVVSNDSPLAIEEPPLARDDSGRAVACHFPLTSPLSVGNGAV